MDAPLVLCQETRLTSRQMSRKAQISILELINLGPPASFIKANGRGRKFLERHDNMAGVGTAL